jgi:hypothetical protein
LNRRAVLLVLLAACRTGAGVTAPGWILRVDQTLERGSAKLPDDPLTDASYRRVEPRDAYTVVVDGDQVTITPLDATKTPISGHRQPGTAEETFTLDLGVFAGGRLVLRGARAELTIFGSGVPIVASERGALIRR